MVTVATVLGDLTSAQMRLHRRAGSGLRRRHGPRDRRSEPGLPLGARAATSRRSTAACTPPGSSRGGRRHGRRRDQLPGRRVVQARGDAVARPRPPARRAVCTSGPIWSPRSPGLDIKISGCPNGCGQHHIAGIGFQGSLRKVGGRPAPHYFVMVGGGVAEGITTFGRHAATIPARRCDEALERLDRPVSRQRAARRDGRSRSSAASISRRSRRALAGLEKIAPGGGDRRGLHRPGRGSRLPPGSAGRRVQRVTASTIDDTPFTSTSVLDLDRPHAAAAAGRLSAPDPVSRSTPRRSSRTLAAR